ncbi:ABC transporter ATP-binding protein [Falsiroseomonas sp.]|uniref:ABC transporter ATP-binding protein n=1 Tax=Falsiroseomonas sp. TaxID=2870721 RepID=UPI002724A666|nr:ABC transporter ATP-binding protein [Falsiroseomonas sp.]MDO9500016.1 ABC transporter ATP-binding protein [Falsiroseomonas sp.]
MTHLRLERLTRRFPGTATPAVDGISLDLPQGALLALLGPSGCGKTTTLRMIAGLEAPDGGHIQVAGRDVTALPPHKRNMGVVFQSYALFPHLSAAANVAFGLEMRGVPRAERAKRVADALTLVGLDGFAARKPRQLSGGQQQRVALARALAPQPDLLLLDEPLSALDAKLREEVRDEIRAVQQRLGTTTVFVTHDQTEALAMADLVAVMNQGRIEQLAPPEEVFERPATRFVATFVGRAAILAAEVVAPGLLRAGGATLQAAETPQSGRAEIFIRPHHLRPLADGEDAANALPARVTRRTYTGDIITLECSSPAGTLLAEVPGGTPAASLRMGDTLRLGVDPGDLRVFPA